MCVHLQYVVKCVFLCAHLFFCGYFLWGIPYALGFVTAVVLSYVGRLSVMPFCFCLVSQNFHEMSLILKGTLFSAQVKMKAFPIHREVIVCRRRDCDQAGAIRVEI